MVHRVAGYQESVTLEEVTLKEVDLPDKDGLPEAGRESEKDLHVGLGFFSYYYNDCECKSTKISRSRDGDTHILFLQETIYEKFLSEKTEVTTRTRF